LSNADQFKPAQALGESPTARRQRWLAALRRQRQAGTLDPALADLISYLESGGLAAARPHPAGRVAGDLFDDDEALRAGLSHPGTPKNVRISLMIFLHMMARVLHTDGIHPWQLAYLITGIRDLDRGIVADWLRVPATKQEPGLAWEARAALVVGLEARMASGETKGGAAEAVVSAVGYGTAQQLIEWRKQFGRRKGSQTPRDGTHRLVLEHWRAKLKLCDNLGAERPRGLQYISRKMTQYAQHMLADQMPVVKRPRSLAHRVG
jgi:hypothetical protein